MNVIPKSKGSGCRTGGLIAGIAEIADMELGDLVRLAESQGPEAVLMALEGVPAVTPEQMSSLLSKLETEHVSSPEEQLEFARLCLSLGDLDRALTRAHEVRRTPGFEGRGWHLIGTCYLSRPDLLKLAVCAFGKGIDYTEGEEARLLTYARAKARYDSGQLQEARLDFQDCGDFEDALAWVERIEQQLSRN